MSGPSKNIKLLDIKSAQPRRERGMTPPRLIRINCNQLGKYLYSAGINITRTSHLWAHSFLLRNVLDNPLRTSVIEEIMRVELSEVLVKCLKSWVEWGVSEVFVEWSSEGVWRDIFQWEKQLTENRWEMFWPNMTSVSSVRALAPQCRTVPPRSPSLGWWHLTRVCKTLRDIVTDCAAIITVIWNWVRWWGGWLHHSDWCRYQ